MILSQAGAEREAPAEVFCLLAAGIPLLRKHSRLLAGNSCGKKQSVPQRISGAPCFHTSLLFLPFQCGNSARWCAFSGERGTIFRFKKECLIFLFVNTFVERTRGGCGDIQAVLNDLRDKNANPPKEKISCGQSLIRYGNRVPWFTGEIIVGIEDREKQYGGGDYKEYVLPPIQKYEKRERERSPGVQSVCDLGATDLVAWRTYFVSGGLPVSGCSGGRGFPESFTARESGGFVHRQRED